MTKQTATIKEFVHNALSEAHEENIAALVDFEIYRNLKLKDEGKLPLPEDLYREYAGKYHPHRKMWVICLLRQYHEYLVRMEQFVNTVAAQLN